MRWLLLACQLFAQPALAQTAVAQPAAPAASNQAAVVPGLDAMLGRPIDQIRIVVEGEPSPETALIDLLATRVGDALSALDVRESIVHLYSLGRFEDVRVDAVASSSGGVLLRYDVTPLHGVGTVRFAGNLGLSRGLLSRTISDRYGAQPPVGRAGDAARTLVTLYRDQGYLAASVRAVPELRHDPDRTILTFEIDAGTRATIADVTIEGDLRASREGFERQLGMGRGTPYEPAELQRRLDAYVQKLRARGFYEASASHRATVAEDKRTVDIAVDVRSGPAITIRYEGDPLPAARLKELVPVERDASVSEDLLEDSVGAIRRLLQQQGYWKADASWRREEEADRATLVFQIRKGARYYLASDVQLAGNSTLAADELRTLIALDAGDLFLESGLSLAAAAITELYRQRGFASATVKYAVAELDPRGPSEGLIAPTITVTEGPRTVVGAVRLAGNAALSETELRPLIRIAEGAPYYQPLATAGREALTVEYLNNGFASVNVTVAPMVSSDRARVDLEFAIHEGPQTIVDHILVVGNTHTDQRIILNELRLQPGKPLGREDRVESERALSALGLFRRVRITELSHGSALLQDVVVTVDEAPKTTIAYGGGVEASERLRAGTGGEAREELELAPRGFFNIGRRNVGGRNRTVDLYTRISVRPRDAPNDPEVDGTGLGFSEYRVVGTFRQPRAWFASDVAVTAAIEQGIRSSFNFARKGLTGDILRRLSRSVRVSGRYSFNTTRTFDERLNEEEQATIDRLFPQVRLSTISAAVSRDTRDDVLDPRRGGFLSGEGSVASRALGGQVGFLKAYVQGSAFREVPGSRVVVAARAAVGLGGGFSREGSVSDSGEPEPIEDLPASERFFAGGDTSIRGFALDAVGTPKTISANGFPRGGNAVLILNSELRIPVWREVGAVLFADGGNVFERVTDLDPGELRGALGLGLRYRSPVGPIRLDLGFKMDRREIGGRREPRAVWHFSIGQAF